MVNYSEKVAAEKPFSVRNKNFEPIIDRESTENAPSSPNQENWARNLAPHDRLFKHATMSSARKRASYIPSENCPKDELDFVMESVFDQLQTFPEKTDPYLHLETVYSEDDPNYDSWRVLRNRKMIVPPKRPERGHPIKYGRETYRENIFHVKLGIASYHSPQTNPGYSRTPSGAFYCI